MPEKNPNNKVQYSHISSENAGQRIDNFLLRCLKGVPKSRIYRLLRRGEVRVNKARIKAKYRLNEGDSIRIPPVNIATPSAPATVPKPLQSYLQNAIIYEDDRLLVINKPAGLAVHGGSGIKIGLIEALRTMMPNQHFLELVHRVDRHTSGCVMIAKQRDMLCYLHEQLRRGTIDKRYLALAIGRWPHQCQRVSAPLQKNTLPAGEHKVRVTPEGKPSSTAFSIVSYYRHATLLEAKPITGKTHQIRVHAQYSGHPLLGDEKYGSVQSRQYTKTLKLRRLFLHASRLSFVYPHTQKYLTVEVPLDTTSQQLLDRLR